MTMHTGRVYRTPPCHHPTSLQVVEVDVSIPPHTTKTVTLHATPKAEGVLTIRGVAWLLQGVAKGYMLFDATRHNRRVVRASKGKSSAAYVGIVLLLYIHHACMAFV